MELSQYVDEYHICSFYSDAKHEYFLFPLVKLLIMNICIVCPHFWLSIIESKGISQEIIDKYLMFIIRYAREKDILILNSNKGELAESINNCVNFISLFEKEENIEKAKWAIKELDIKFKNINPEHVDKELFNHLCENNRYALNTHMLKLVLDSKLDLVDSLNYTNILATNYEPLIDYINQNILYFIDTILLSIINYHENEDVVIELFSLEDVTEEYMIKIIDKCNFKATYFSRYDLEIWSNLLINKRADKNW